MDPAPGEVFPQNRVAHSLAAFGMHDYGLWYEDFNFVDPDAQLSSEPCYCLELGHVNKQVQTDIQGGVLNLRPIGLM